MLELEVTFLLILTFTCNCVFGPVLISVVKISVIGV